MKRFGIIAAALLASACIPDKITNTDKATQSPSTPTGSIVGVVTNMSTGAALAGVTVTTMNENGAFVTDTTDASGAYALTGLRAGVTYNLKYSLTGYTTRLDSAFVDDMSGDFPSPGLTEKNQQLPPATGSVAGTVYYTDGAPAGAVTLVVDLRSSGYDLVTTATSDATTGDFTINNLPATLSGFTVTVRSEPWDAEADGIVDFNTGTFNVNLFPGIASPLFVDLRNYAVGLSKLFANVDSGILLNTLPIQFTYNRELDLANTTATLTDYDAGKSVAVNLALDTTGKILTITPNDGSALAAFHDYGVSVYAKAPNGASVNSTVYFVAETSSTLLGAVQNLIVTPLANATDFSTTYFTLSWDALTDAYGYRVYVRDTSRNPDWLLVNTVGTSLTPGYSFGLPSTFDYYSNDSYQTPFMWGVDVEFAVVAVNQAGDAPSPDTATSVIRSDLVAPTVTSAMWANNVYLDNRGNASTKQVDLPVTFSEYLDRTNAAYTPVLNGLPASVTGLTWTWNANTMGGTFSFSIPANTDGGVASTLTVTGARDTSGNAMTTLTLSDVITNGTFEANNITGWYTTGTDSTASLAAASNAAAANGTYSARVGDSGAITTYGYSYFSQDFNVPAGAKNIRAQIAIREYEDQAGSNGYYYCYLANASGGAIYSLSSGYIDSNSSGFTTYTVNVSNYYAGQSLIMRCYAYDYYSTVSAGIYVDNASVVVSR